MAISRAAMRICMSMAITIPTIGTAFVVQASVSFALALLILLWSIVASVGRGCGGRRLTGRFALSRTVGLFGFSEQDGSSSPHAAVDVAAELLVVGLWAVDVIGHRRAHVMPSEA